MKYTLKMLTIDGGTHEHFSNEEELCEFLCGLIVNAVESNQLVLFEDIKDTWDLIQENETVVEIYDGNERLIPISEGGNWQGFDDYIKDTVTDEH